MGFLDDLVQTIAQLKQPTGEVWFRGQADGSWPLVPRLLRSDLAAEEEKNMIARFRSRAMGIVHDHPADEDVARWLFLMQHHGLPTRLLDWSESALFALFFAIITEPDLDGRLFILVPMALNQQQIGEHVLIAPNRSPCCDILEASFTGAEPPKKIVAINTYASNDRLARQRGGFTVHGMSDDLEQVTPPHALRSIVIPAAQKGQLVNTLSHLGVTWTTLFHDLDALAMELRERYGLV